MQSHASFWEAVKGALQSLRGSKLRSFLTLLGIILATTTLIAVMSVISGMNVVIAQNVSDMGADHKRAAFADAGHSAAIFGSRIHGNALAQLAARSDDELCRAAAIMDRLRRRAERGERINDGAFADRR